jgi:hypothetical protein
MGEATVPFPLRVGLPAQAVGVFLLLQIIFIRAISAANANYVSFFGHELHWVCWFKQLTGIPCPACGMSRSVILTLHGHLGQAFQINSAGPLAVIGLLLFASGMLFLGSRQNSSSSESLSLLRNQIWCCSLVYSMALLAVVVTSWITKIA